MGKNRFRQYEEARKKAGADFDLVILDDGFQNQKIKKDLEIVAVTSASRTEKIFRDWNGELRFADLIVWTKGFKKDHTGEGTGPDFFSKWSDRLVKGEFKIQPYPGFPPLDLNQSYWLVTGVADGKSVRSSLECKIEKHIQFRDHARYDEKMIEVICKEAQASGCKVLLTGKDWVKWREWGVLVGEVSVVEPQFYAVEGDPRVDLVICGREIV